MSEAIEQDVQALLKIQNNLKKSINNKITNETLKAKWQYVSTLFNKIETEVSEEGEFISDSKLKFLVKASREAYNEIKHIIKLKLQENSDRQEQNTIIMANPPAPTPFDFKTATALIQNYDGSPTGLDTFLDSVGLFADLTPQEHIATGIRFLKTKLSGKARSAIPPNAQTFAEITDAIKQACKSVVKPEVILAKLANEKQITDLTKFTEQLEKLTLQLEHAYVAEEVPLATASRLAIRAGTNALANGIKNKETQLIIKAGKFDTLAEAIGKANEHEKSTTNNAVFYYRGQSYNHVTGHRGRNTRGFTPRGRYAHRGQHNSNQSNYMPSRGRGGHSYRNGYGNRGGNNYRGGNFHHQNRVFYAQQGNMHAPQHMNVGGMTGMTGMTVNSVQPAPQSNQQVPLQNQQVALANIVRR